MLKKMIGLLCLFLLSYTLGYAAVPVIFYSDLTSGPKTGGQNNKGVFVTINGKNFGSSQGSSYVSIGGGQADNYPVWSDTKISFQLGSAAATGNITITNTAGTSNGVSFTVRAGNIYFVDGNVAGTGTGSYNDPWQSPASYCSALNGIDGATCYFRAGTYNGEYAHAGWHGNFILADSDGHSGSAGNENAFIGYPGEIVNIQNAGSADRNNFSTNGAGSYIVVANFHCIANGGSIGADDNWRVVDNVVTGINALSGTGIITIDGDNIKIYGNEITGGSSGNKLDHAFYPHEGNNLDFGWNWIHDNNFAQGPMISNNHDTANTNGWTFNNYLIHDNVIDMSSYPSRAIGIADVGNASTFYIYNNVIIGPSTSDPWNPVLYAWFGTVSYLNNTIYNCGNGTVDNSIFWMDAGVTSATFQNNIAYANSATANYMRVTGSPAIINDHNCWYGIGSFATHSSGLCGTNANAVEADPLFWNTTNKDFHLKENSPCINKGANASNIVSKDKDGVNRTINDIGAYEYGSGGVSAPALEPIILSTPPNQDTIPPAAITSLRVIGYSRNSITLYWIASGDNGMIGTAESYDVRYSKLPIYEGNFLNATKVTKSPVPAIVGTKKSFVITNLEPGTRYYFAIKAKDKAGNISAISNIVSGQTKSKR